MSRFDSYSVTFVSGQLAELQIQAFVHRPQLIIAFFKIDEHHVERLAELLKFIPRVDVGPYVQIAFGHFFRRLLKHVAPAGESGAS